LAVEHCAVAIQYRVLACSFAVNGFLQDAFMAASQGDDAIGVKGVSLTLTTRSGEDYVTHVLPLTSVHEGAPARSTPLLPRSSPPKLTGDAFARGPGRTAL
jgi:hypothetical protein